MIMQGNTPRSLTWPGCLAVVALGLTCLPMLPSLHGQAVYTQETPKLMAEVEAAKAQLAVHKALLEQQKAAIAHEEEQLKKAVAEIERQTRIREEKKRQGAITLSNQLSHDREKKNEFESKTKARIEILVNAEDLDLRDRRNLSKKLKEVFPGKKIFITIQVPASSQFNAPPSPPPSQQDKRINELEKKLEKVLQELHELRKQMRESHPAPPLPPAATPTPPRFKLVPHPEAPKHSPSLDPESLDNPYYAPTVPLAPPEKKPIRRVK